MTDTKPRCWLDTETTRLDHDRRPWEIALIVRRPGEPDHEYEWLIDVNDLDLDNADPDSLKFGGFYERHPAGSADPHGRRNAEETVAEKPVLAAIAELTRGAVVHGSNPSFDTEMLAARMRAHGLRAAWHYHSEDVPSVARGWLLGRGLPAPRKSDDISRACGVDPDDYARHSALGDCRWLRDLSDLMEPRTDLQAAA